MIKSKAIQKRFNFGLSYCETQDIQNYLVFFQYHQMASKRVFYFASILIMLRLIPFILGIVLSLSTCEPFGLRIYYGDVVIDPTSQEKLAIYFNTKQICSDSYASIVSNNQLKNMSCLTTVIQGSVKMAYYVAYVHSCSTNDITFEESFNYTVYGWNATTQTTPVPYNNGEWIVTTLINPLLSTRNVKMIVMADWGVIQGNIMISTTNYIKTAIAQKDINAIVIAGDIAYDLHTSNGQIYEEFLGLMQEFSPRLPFFLAPGNHERIAADSAYLFNQSFKVYGVDKKLATGIYFGSVFLTIFDHFNPVYNRAESISSLTALKTQLVKGSQSGRFILPLSHYPLQCSGQPQQCQTIYDRTKSYFDAMLDNGVSLYIGAHSHLYQRSFPYYRNGTFSKQQSPYVSGKYIISIVQGVGGSNRTLLVPNSSSDPFQLQSFTNKYLMNQTGYAVIEVSKDYVLFKHFSTTQGWFDTFIILLSSSSNTQTTQSVSQTVIIILAVLLSAFVVVLAVIILRRIFRTKKTSNKVKGKNDPADATPIVKMNEQSMNEVNFQSGIKIEEPKTEKFT